VVERLGRIGAEREKVLLDEEVERAHAEPRARREAREEDGRLEEARQ
jgi:hypothetical protein